MKRRALTNSEKDIIGRQCANCGATDDLTYHHIIPLALGGSDQPSNMVCLCGACHYKIHGVDVSMSALRKRAGSPPGWRKRASEAIIARIVEDSATFGGSMTDEDLACSLGIKVSAVCRYKTMIINQGRAERRLPQPEARLSQSAEEVKPRSTVAWPNVETAIRDRYAGIVAL